MRAVHQFCLTGSLLVLFVVGCDRPEPLAPDFGASTSNGSGPNVNAPSGTSAVAVSYSGIEISWRDNSSNETGFEIHRSATDTNGAFTLLATTAAGVGSYGDGGLTASTAYCYEVRAFRTTGNKRSYSAFSSVTCATTPAAPVPAAPSAAHAAPQQGRWIIVTWTDNSTNETGFRVERAPASTGPWTSVATPVQNTTALNDFAFGAEEQTVCYRVFATNSYGDSPASNVFCTAVPATPSNLAATLGSDGSVDLTWTDNSAVEDGFAVYRNGSVVATLPPNTTGYHDTGLTPDVTYGYQVRATKDGGTSDNSNFVQVVFATTPPAAPANLGVQPTSSSSVYGLWLDQSSNEAGFRVERSINGGASWMTAATTGTDEYYFGEAGLSAEQQACYRVFAFNSLGDSPPSNTACTTPPAAPTDLTATTVDFTSFDLAWTDNSAAEDGFEVWLYDGYGDFYPIASLGPNTTTYRVQDGYSYYYVYYVIATKDGGYSDWSNGTYAIPPAGSSALRAGSMSGMQTPPRPPVRRRGP